MASITLEKRAPPPPRRMRQSVSERVRRMRAAGGKRARKKVRKNAPLLLLPTTFLDARGAPLRYLAEKKTWLS